MTKEPTLLEIKKLIDDLAEILDVIHVEISEMKTEFQELKKNLKENNIKKDSDKIDFMHG
jgi:hypothetical protein